MQILSANTLKDQKIIALHHSSSQLNGLKFLQFL